MRWNAVVTLLSAPMKYQDAMGVWHEGKREKRTVFCNEYTIGSLTMAHLRSSDVRMANDTERVDVGMHSEKMLQLRSASYSGEDQVIYKGIEYEVLYASGAGEFITITIAQKLGNTVVEDGI